METVYTCPMHPEVQQATPGMCPECGMALVKKSYESQKTYPTHTTHETHSLQAFSQKFWISLALSFPVVLYSELPERIFGWRAPEFTGSAWLPLLLSSVVFFYGGWIFLASSYRELRAKLPGMMTLIAIAITAAYAYSVFSTLSGTGNTLFWELTTLITVMLLGHYIEMRSVQSAQGALKELSKLLPDTAEVIRDGKPQIVPVSQLKLGDLVLVRPGGKIPADGVVAEGASEVNESMITGESKPVSKMKEQEVIAGTVNGSGSLTVKVTKIGEQTFLSGVMRLVAEAQASKSRLQLLSDKAAFYLTVVAVGAGGVTLLGWIISGAEISVAVERFVAVLVIACPHALGLAVPLVASISTTLAARNGLLVKKRSALEAARNIDVVLFDKTGTLTTGQYGVEKIFQPGTSIVIPDAAKRRSGIYIHLKEVLQLAASVDAQSEHVVAKAIVEKARNENVSLAPVREFQAIPGKGARGVVGGKDVFVGGHSILSHVGATAPQELRRAIEMESKKGKTIVYVLRDKTVLGALVLADLIREESRQAIHDLKKLGMKIAMITGDSEDVATWVSEALGVDEYFARVLPDQKSEKVRELQKRGLKVAMVGDGINDAPALTQADLGIAIGAGTNVAIESAGIILVRNDPGDIVKIIRLSRLTYRKMIENLFWATGYNVLAIPLAAGVLASRGIILQPAFSAFLMSLSTIIVSMNALLLRRTKLV